MNKYIYRKSDLAIITTISPNSTFEDEFNLNVKTNHVGNIEEFAVVKTNLTIFHLENIDGEIIVIDDTQELALIEALKPTEEEIRKAEIELVTLNLLSEVGLL